jgi:hypothetical protein
MKPLTYILILLLFLLHQDFWWWDDGAIVLGFIPISLAYHTVFSLAAAGVWALALKTIWPTRWEAWAEESDDSQQP